MTPSLSFCTGNGPKRQHLHYLARVVATLLAFIARSLDLRHSPTERPCAAKQPIPRDATPFDLNADWATLVGQHDVGGMVDQRGDPHSTTERTP